MRANLVELYGKEIVVKGKYKSYAVTSGYRNYLFTHIMYNDVEITGHMWIRLPNDVGRSLKKKKEYEFTGKVVKYFKGKDVEKEKTMDYCISNCRNFVEIVEEEDKEEDE